MGVLRTLTEGALEFFGVGWKRNWKRVASERGLKWHAEQQRISGWIDGRYVLVFEDSELSRVCVLLWPPLDLGLRTPAASRSASFDKAEYPTQLIASARDPRRTNLLFDGELRSYLGERQLHVGTIQLWDDRVEFSVPGVIPVGKLRGILPHLLQIARTVDQARDGVSPPPEIAELQPGWEQLAAERHLAPRTCPYGFVGADAGIQVRFFVRRREDAWFIVAFAGFRSPLEIGFRGVSAAAASHIPWSMSPFVTGDPAFDATYHVSAFETHYVKEALSEKARTRLCELVQSWQHVVVDDYGVTIEMPLGSHAATGTLLDEARSAAELVDFIHPKKRAAYR